jgi:hypothetical protein
MAGQPRPFMDDVETAAVADDARTAGGDLDRAAQDHAGGAVDRPQRAEDAPFDAFEFVQRLVVHAAPLP